MSAMPDEPSYEELPQPKPRRAGRVLLALLVLAAAGAAIVRLTSSPGSATNTADTTTAPAPTPVPVPIPAIVRVGPVRPLDYRPPPDCPRATDGQVACTTYVGLAAPTAQALRERFPRIVVLRAVTQMLRATGPQARTGLWSREIIARVQALKLRIAVRLAEPGDAATAGLRQGFRLQLIQYIRGAYFVQVELRGPVDPESLSRTIGWLLTEPRLVRPAYPAGGTMER